MNIRASLTQSVEAKRSGSHDKPSLRAPFWTVGALTVLLFGLWLFPKLWYTRTDTHLGHFWLTEETNVSGWTFQEVPVSKSAEAVLVADRLVNGEFTSADGRVARVFSAKRYVESSNEIGLFVHTPDRCWTQSGWKMEPTQPETKELVIHGIPIVFERRIFSNGGHRELVYFAGLVGGQPLPYRLDQNLSVGMRYALQVARDKTGTTLRASDRRFWRRVWQSFLSRRPLVGPKQFLRISTTILDTGVGSADALLQRLLPVWLRLAPYDEELRSYRRAGVPPAKKPL